MEKLQHGEYRYIGNIELLDTKCVGFVGARKAHDFTLGITRFNVGTIAENGVTIVSGYANGVDMCAHKKALKVGGSTIIVLPYGLDHFRIHKDIEAYWDWNRVLVLSQFEDSAPFGGSRAFARNATIVKLSDAVVVMQAAIKSGSINTGMQALKQGKPLFVLEVGPGSKYTSFGGNAELIKRGATPLAHITKGIDEILTAIQHDH